MTLFCTMLALVIAAIAINLVIYQLFGLEVQIIAAIPVGYAVSFFGMQILLPWLR